jgi:branched-subunit amino acid transport protein
MNKFKSVKVWALIFCCGLLAYIVISGALGFVIIAQILAYAPLSYFAANIFQDWVFKDKDKLK